MSEVGGPKPESFVIGDVAKPPFAVLPEPSSLFFQRSLRLDTLAPGHPGACPVCGSGPMTSTIVGWPKAHNTRFCTCSLCACMWNVLRVKCLKCSSTDGIAYRAIEGQPDTVKAETCEKCRSDVKVLYQVNDPVLEALADDVASLGLDMLLAGEGWKRGGENPFLLGY